MERSKDRRMNYRKLCAELVELSWMDSLRARHHRVANLEDISASGFCVQSETPILIGTHLEIRVREIRLSGIVVYSISRDGASFLGVKADEICRPALERLEPEHLLDPRDLVELVLSRQQQKSSVHTQPGQN